MDDVLEELLERAETVPVPLDPPTDDDLLEVQEKLFLSLPKDYREFLMHASHLVLGSLEPATASDPSSHTYVVELCAEAWNSGLPRYLIVICTHPQGFYCIDPEGAVVNWQNQNITDTEWESIWEWAHEIWLNS